MPAPTINSLNRVDNPTAVFSSISKQWVEKTDPAERDVFSLICVAPRFCHLIYKRLQKLRQKPQHVENISADVPYIVTCLYHIGHSLSIEQQKRDAM